MEQDRNDRVLSLLDSFLDGHRDEIGDSTVLGAVPVDYVASYLDSPSSDSVTEKLISSKTESLLDAFLKSGSDKLDIKLEVQETEETDEAAEDIDDTYFTETLARIYLKQHKYDRALEIIRSLYLNFPNKSIYFADQIRYLEKLVRINQKNK